MPNVSIKKVLFLIFIFSLLYKTGFGAVSDNNSGEYIKDTTFLITAKAGLEQYYFYQKKSPYNDSFSEIKTDVSPINLYYCQVDVSIPLFFFKTIYKYKYIQNGFIDNDENQYIKDNVDNPKIQYLLNITSGLMGVEFNYLFQNFNNGYFKYYRSNLIPDDNTVKVSKERNIFSGTDYISIYKQQFDVKYHVNWNDIPEYGGSKRSQSGNDLVFGYRFVKSRSPLIIYTRTMDEDLLIGESLPQIATTYYHLIGIGVDNNNKPLQKGFNLLMGGMLYTGYSYMECKINDFWFLQSAYEPGYDPSNDKNNKLHMMPINFSGNAGLNYCLTNGLLITSIRIDWFFDAFYQFGHYSEDENDYSSGNAPFEIFHSIRLSCQIKF